MIFLNPAVLFGLLAASIPVLIHLLNLRRLKRVDFSTLNFLKELQKNKIRKIKIKQLLLLALRVLIILFLVAAFARPTLEGISIGGAASAAKTTAVFILDDTFSMSVVDNNGSYLNRAKETIKKILNELQEGDEAALILVSDFKNEEIKPTNNFVDFLKEIESVEPKYYSGTLNAAITKASKILSASKNFNKEIYILSDFQTGRLADEKSFSDLSEILNENVKIYSFNFSGKDVFNIGIDDIKINNQIFEKDKSVSFNLTVTNYSEKPADNVVVSLFINNERSAQQSVNLSRGESKILTIKSVIKNNGYVNIFAEIEDDDILQDNKRFTSLFIPDKIPVIIFSDEEKDSRFIRLALTSSENTDAINVTSKNINQISSVDISQYDAAVIITSKRINIIDRIKSYIQNGGGLFLMPASESTLEEFKNITEDFGLPQPVSESGKTGNLNNSFSFENIDLHHPIFQNIFSDDKNKIESPDIYHHFKITTGGKGKNIISLIDGSTFLSEYKKGKGKVFLLNTAPVLSWSNFPLKSIFPPLIYKSIYYLASKDKSSSNYIAGDEVIIDAANRNVPQVKIEKPDKTEEFFNMEENTSNFITFDNTNLTGNYEVFSGNKLINDFPVNADPRESFVKYLSEDEFENYLEKINFKGHYIKVNKDDNPSEIILQSRFGSELWKYFLFAAIILALIEMAIARNTKKEMVGI